MIQQLPECCWYFDCGPWEEPHFATEGEALADEREAAEVDDRAPRPLLCTPAGCWVADCDRCGRRFDDEDIGVLHYPGQRQLTTAVDAAGWRVVVGGWLCCPDCAAARPTLCEVARVAVTVCRGGAVREVVGEATACPQLAITADRGGPVLTHRPTGTCLPLLAWTSDVAVLHRVAELLTGLDWSSSDPTHYATGYTGPVVAAVNQAVREAADATCRPTPAAGGPDQEHLS